MTFLLVFTVSAPAAENSVWYSVDIIIFISVLLFHISTCINWLIMFTKHGFNLETSVGGCWGYDMWYTLIVKGTDPLADNSVVKVCILASLYKSTSCYVDTFSSLIVDLYTVIDGK